MDSTLFEYSGATDSLYVRFLLIGSFLDSVFTVVLTKSAGDSQVFQILITLVSLGCPSSVFNKNSTLNGQNFKFFSQSQIFPKTTLGESFQKKFLSQRKTPGTEREWEMK